MHKNSKQLFILSFLIIILLPFFQSSLNLNLYEPLSENRYRATRPDGNPIIEILLKGEKYKVEYENFYNDNYGFRDLLIKLKNQIDYSIFGFSEEVVINKNSGFLFDRDYLEKYRVEIDRANDKEYERLFRKIIKLNLYFNEREIKLILVPIPLADYIYPDLYDNSEINKPDLTGYERLIIFLKEHPEITFVNIQEVFNQNKNDFDLYYKTDSHYTPIGAFLTEKEIVNTLGNFTEPKVEWEYPLVSSSSGKLEGTLSQYLATLKPYKEPSISIQKTWNDCSFEKSPNYWENKCSLHRKLISPTVIFGNSFMSLFFNYGFPDHFTELHSRLLTELEADYSKLPEDIEYVIVEFYEIDLWGFLFGNTLPEIQL